jgi:hypothetical protein
MFQLLRVKMPPGVSAVGCNYTVLWLNADGLSTAQLTQLLKNNIRYFNVKVGSGQNWQWLAVCRETE